MMNKPGIEIKIPYFAEPLRVERIVTDYSGTLTFSGRLISGVAERLRTLKELAEIDVLTADSFGTALTELAPVGSDSFHLHRLPSGEKHDIKKQNHVQCLGPARIAAIGNGNNDALMLNTVKDAGGLAIAVDNGEGCAVAAIQNANLFIVGIANALDLLLDRTRLKATLRR